MLQYTVPFNFSNEFTGKRTLNMRLFKKNKFANHKKFSIRF